jgi:hypothetical protein
MQKERLHAILRPETHDLVGTYASWPTRRLFLARETGANCANI